MRHLVRHRFQISPSCLPLAASTTAFSLLSTTAGWASERIHGRRIARTPIVDPPLFVIGHWRSGTTFLFNLLAQDPQFTWPTTLQCFTPGHFLLTAPLLRHLDRFYARARQSDGMPEGLDAPKEDEFALCMLGLGSPYNTQLFPNHGAADIEYLDFKGVPLRERTRWKKAFMHFARALTLQRPGRLLFKSPTHTARIPLLLEIFPQARFVHIRRNPYDIFPSTAKVWRLVWGVLQEPDFERLDEYIFSHFERMDAALVEGIGELDPSRLHQLRYEDLAADPLRHLQAIYDQFELDGFDRVRGSLEKFLQRLGPYHEHPYALPAETVDAITRRWGRIITRWGYPLR